MQWDLTFEMTGYCLLSQSRFQHWKRVNPAAAACMEILADGRLAVAQGNGTCTSELPADHRIFKRQAGRRGSVFNLISAFKNIRPDRTRLVVEIFNDGVGDHQSADGQRD